MTDSEICGKIERWYYEAPKEIEHHHLCPLSSKPWRPVRCECLALDMSDDLDEEY